MVYLLDGKINQRFPKFTPVVRKDTYKGRLDEVPGVFSKMDPMPGAVEAFQTLAWKYDTYILSTSPWENPLAWMEKLNWVRQHLGYEAYKRLILSHHKHLNRGDFLIDDRPNNGAAEFQGELIQYGSDEFPDWESVLLYLESQIPEVEKAAQGLTKPRSDR